MLSFYRETGATFKPQVATVSLTLEHNNVYRPNGAFDYFSLSWNSDENATKRHEKHNFPLEICLFYDVHIRQNFPLRVAPVT